MTMTMSESSLFSSFEPLASPADVVPAVAPEHGWPPPPHDPRERVVLGTVGAWQVLGFAPDDVKFDYFASRGFLHLQLWHPEKGVSLLTPSCLTAGRYEGFPLFGWKYASADLAKVSGFIGSLFDIEVPPGPWLLALHRWYVSPAERRALRKSCR